MFQFLQLLEPVENEIKQFEVNHIAKKCIEDLTAKDKISNDLKTISDCALLSDMVSWLIQRRSEIDAIYLLLKGNQMDMYDIAEIESRPPSSSEKRARVFVLKVDYTPDPLMERIQNFIGNLEPVIQIPTFSAITSGKERQGVIGKAFHGFSEEARWCSNENNSYQIGLVSSSSPLTDATIKTFLFPAIKTSQVCLPAAQSSPVESPAQKPQSSDAIQQDQRNNQLLRPTSAPTINNFLRQSNNSPFTHRKKLTVPKESQHSNEKVANFLLKSITMISTDIFYDENDG